MPHSSDRPLLFLDIDGPLIPFGAPPPGRRPAGRSAPGRRAAGQLTPGRGRAGHRSTAEPGNPLLAGLDPGHGPRLWALPCDLVWATTWMADANEVVGRRLGLPELPVLDWPDPDSGPDDDRGLHWKTRGLVGWAAGRPFVWVDDDITDTDRAWVAAHHPGPALLHHVDPRRGLTDSDFAVIHRWLTRR